MENKIFDWNPIIETLKNLKNNVMSQEDWFTECIKLALFYDKDFAKSFLENIFRESKCKTTLEDFEIEKITSQVQDGNNIYDLVIEIREREEQKRVIIEVKRGAGVSEKKEPKESKVDKINQLQKYIKKCDYLTLISTNWHSLEEIKKEVFDDPKYLKPANQNNFLWCDFYKLFEEHKDKFFDNKFFNFIKEEVMNDDRPCDLKQISTYLDALKRTGEGKQELFRLRIDPNLRAKIVEIAMKIGADNPEEKGWYGYLIKKDNKKIRIGFYPYWISEYTKEILKVKKDSLKRYIIKVPNQRGGEKEVVDTPCFIVRLDCKKDDIKDIKPTVQEFNGVNIYYGKGEFKENNQEVVCKVAVFNLLDILDIKDEIDINTIAELLNECIKIVSPELKKNRC